jgi:hypothetical protein
METKEEEELGTTCAQKTRGPPDKAELSEA